MGTLDQRDGRRLRSCLWELTLRCSMRCLHCGSVAGRARSGELALDECFAIVEQLAELGCSELTFIGGEIFLFEGWQRVARAASDRGMAVNVMTNGDRLDDDEVGRIRFARLRNVGISIDGMEATHDRIRRQGSFRRVTDAFDRLERAGIPTVGITSLMEQNFPDLEPLYDVLVSHGVTLWQLQLVNPMGNMAGRRDLVLRRDRIPALIDFIREKGCERKMVVLAADSIGYYHEDSEPYIRGRGGPVCCWEGCQAGITACFIDSVGNVKGCGALYDDAFVEGNVRQRPLREIWEDEAAFRFNRAFDVGLLEGSCRGCDVGDVCRGGCRASNFFTTGTPYESAFCAHAPAWPGAR